MKREYAGAAKTTALTGAITAAATTINVTDATGWPTGAVGPFVVTIDAGVTTEEKVLCSGRTGNSLAVQARGFDGTAASDHANAATVQHTLSATDLREANDHVNDTTGDPHPQYITAAKGAALYPTLGHTHPAPTVTKTIRVPLTFSVPGTVTNNTDDLGQVRRHFVPAPPGQTVRLVGARAHLATGEVSWRIQRAGAIIVGTVNTTSAATSSTSVSVVMAGDDLLELFILTPVGPTAGLTVTAYLDVVI